MVGRQWRHPRHDRPAVAALMVDWLAFVSVVFSFHSTNLYVNDRKGINKAYAMINDKVSCKDNICTDEGGDLELWQLLSTSLILLGFVFNSLSVLCLVVFWGIVAAGRVVHFLVRMAQVCDFLGAPMKFAGAFIIVHHVSCINAIFAWTDDKKMLGINTAPIGFALCSQFLQTLGFAANTIVLDTGPQGGKNYWEILDEEELKEHPQEQEIYRRASYMPDVSKTHSRVLSVSHVYRRASEFSPTPSSTAV